MNVPVATVVITTKSRKEELARALDSCIRQDAQLEILVIDDGSTDGTYEFVRTKYPGINIVRSEDSRGYIVQRNAAARLAKGDIIFSIDDDAEFSDKTIVTAVLRELDRPEIAGVAIPFIDVNRSSEQKQTAPDSISCWITNEFIGTAHAIRRATFLQVGGYRESLMHQGEEGDLCIRLLECGKLVRLASCKPVYHYESPRRNIERMNYFGQRNLLLFGWYNVPNPECIPHMLATTARGLLWGLRHRAFLCRVRGTLGAVQALIRNTERRRPVSRKIYWLYRRLKKRGPLRFEQIAA